MLWGLLEINLLGRTFTWSNNQDDPIFSHIDRILYSTNFDGHFPLATAKALPRNPSDYVPILWEFGEGQTRNRPRFKFEKWWLMQLEFKQIVSKVWNSPIKGENALDRW
jgi:hypothetical protein